MSIALPTWLEKSDRAESLASEHDATGDVLRFYANVLKFQEGVQMRLVGDAENVSRLLPFVPDFLALLARSGTPEMKQLAESAAAVDWAAELQNYWQAPDNREYLPQTFIALTLLQPFARHLAAQSQFDLKRILPRCPFCQSAPQLGVLRPEGEGGKRYLLCSLCGTEWEYRRVICPNCEESDKEKLPTFTSDKVPHVKLAACDTCHSYLKCIDLGVDGRAIPEVDDVATLPMSLWMMEKGFRPIKVNLFGF